MAIQRILFLILIVLALAGLGVGLFYTFHSQTLITKKELPQSSAPGEMTITSLSLITKTPGTALIMLSPHGNLPTLIQLEVAYDPQNLANMTITPGNFFTDTRVALQLLDPITGRISYALTGTPKRLSGSETATVATLSFLPVFATSQETPLQFLPKTMVRDKTGKALPLEMSGTILRWR